MNNKDIDKGKPFDWGKTSKSYALFRDIYPQEFYDKLLEFGVGARGQRVLDLGTGTGVIPRNLYKYGARFTGLDIAAPQIKEARRLSEQAGMDITYRVCPAEQIDFPADSFDAAIACQCFFYFDTSVLMPRLKNALVDGGRLAILFMAWLPDESPIAKSSENLVLSHNPDWTGAGMKRKLFDIPEWLDDYAFTVEHNIGFDVDLEFSKHTWNGRMVACRGIGASLPPQKMAGFEAEHLKLLNTLTRDKTFTIPHYATMLILKNNKK